MATGTKLAIHVLSWSSVFGSCSIQFSCFHDGFVQCKRGREERWGDDESPTLEMMPLLLLAVESTHEKPNEGGGLGTLAVQWTTELVALSCHCTRELRIDDGERWNTMRLGCRVELGMARDAFGTRRPQEWKEPRKRWQETKLFSKRERDEGTRERENQGRAPTHPHWNTLRGTRNRNKKEKKRREGKVVRWKRELMLTTARRKFHLSSPILLRFLRGPWW